MSNFDDNLMNEGIPGEGGEGGAADGGWTGSGFGAEGDLDPMAGLQPEARKKKHTGALILILVVGLAIGMLFSMHTLTKVTAASGKDTDIERTIEQFIGKLNDGDLETDPNAIAEDLVGEHEEVIAVLKNDFTNEQVEVVMKNPFDIDSGMMIADSGVPTDPNVARAVRRDQVERAAETLRLKSIIMGSRPLAAINGKIVRLNGTVPVELSRAAGVVAFRVDAITSDAVTVVVEEPEIELRIEKILYLKKR